MKFYYFNSTHWDREWYQPFQHYRKYLLDTVSGLLDTLENNPQFEKFTFDGQTIVLEDVVEIRPDWRERLVRQIAANRLNVGPWYVMPDEFLVSGEALIRNLLVGHEVAEEFGGHAWPIGYLCDMFGHIAQMPQILQGFIISTAVAWRGLACEMLPFLRWESPDRSKCNLIKLEAFRCDSHDGGASDEGSGYRRVSRKNVEFFRG
jgi:alpha-mannosidase